MLMGNIQEDLDMQMPDEGRPVLGLVIMAFGIALVVFGCRLWWVRADGHRDDHLDAVLFGWLLVL